MGELNVPRELIPSSLAALIAAAGCEAALLVIETYGGSRKVLPTNTERPNWLTNTVGAGAAEEIVHAFGRARPIDLPLATWWRVATYFDRGDSVAKIARKLGFTERRVRQFKARLVQKGVIPPTPETTTIGDQAK